MRLLIAVIFNPAKVFDILDEFYQVGIMGSTVLDSIGMAHIMAHHVPYFSRFADLDEDPGQNKTILIAIESDEELAKAIAAIERIVGDLEKPDTGVVMTLPIEYHKGLKKIKQMESGNY